MAQQRRPSEQSNSPRGERETVEPVERAAAKKDRSLLSRKWLWALLMLVVLVCFLPTIVARTPLKQVVIDQALANFKGRITVETIACGWISDTELTNVVATDESGNPLFQVGSLKIGKSLTSILNATDYGTIQIERPVLHLKLRPDGSNLEDALADLLPTGEQSAGPSPAAILAITEGQVLLTDATTKRQYNLDKLTADIEAFQPDGAPLRINLKGNVTNQDQADTGAFEVKLAFDAGKNQLDFENGLASLETSQLPIEFVSPVLSRYVESMALSGTMNGKVTANWSAEDAAYDIDLGSTEFSNLMVDVPDRLADDKILLTNAWLKGRFSITPQKMQADRLAGYTEMGWFKADGELNWQQIAAASGAQIPANNFQAEGSVNLAPLVSMLSNTIPLQSGIQLKAGTIQFNAGSRIEGTDRRLVVNVESSGITAIRDNQQLNWDKPARVVAAIRQTKDNALLVESFNCRTNFLSLNGSANRDTGEFQVQGNLQSALAEVKQFLDVGDLELGGEIDGKFAWQFDGNSQDNLESRPLRAGGRFRVDKPLVQLPEQGSWSENEIEIVVQLSGQRLANQGGIAEAMQSIRLDSGKLDLIHEGQTLEALLAEPLIGPSWDSDWKLNCKVGGDLKTWFAQLNAFVPVDAVVTGNLEANAQITVKQGKQIWVEGMKYECRDLFFDGYGVTLNEPEMGGEIAAGYEISSGKLQITDATLATSAFSVRAQEMLWDPRAGMESLSGQIALLADVNRCMATVNPNPGADSLQWFGRANGTIELVTNEKAINSKIVLDLSDIVAASFERPRGGVQNVSSGGTWVRVFDEPAVAINSTLQLSRDLQHLVLNDAQVKASVLEARVTGQIRNLSNSLDTDLEGTWEPNWLKLKPLVDSMLGGMASLEGLRGGSFRMQGPACNPRYGQPGESWINPEFKVATAATWQSGQILGLPIGGSQLDLQLAQGIAIAQTQNIPFSNGLMRLSPQLDLRGEESVLYLTPGEKLEQVELSPEICRAWLQYVAPVIAGATTAQGRISLGINKARIPLDSLETSSVEGVVTLHQAGIGPGPVGQQLVQLVNRIKSFAQGAAFTTRPAAADAQWLKFPQQKVVFRIENGRVINEGIEFRIEDIVIRTSGSVGFDQSMDMVAEIPILPHWTAKNALAKHLSGKTIKIPIRGTVQKPQIDGSILQKLTKNILQDSAGKAINNELQGLFQKGNQNFEKEVLGGLKGIFGNGK